MLQIIGFLAPGKAILPGTLSRHCLDLVPTFRAGCFLKSTVPTFSSFSDSCRKPDPLELLLLPGAVEIPLPLELLLAVVDPAMRLNETDVAQREHVRAGARNMMRCSTVSDSFWERQAIEFGTLGSLRKESLVGFDPHNK